MLLIHLVDFIEAARPFVELSHYRIESAWQSNTLCRVKMKDYILACLRQNAHVNILVEINPLQLGCGDIDNSRLVCDDFVKQNLLSSIAKMQIEVSNILQVG